ncbi:MAG TPA: serine/threonine-protein kinase [Polyangiaceae bacterium]
MDSNQLTAISGAVIHSESQPGVSYRLERCIGEGGMGVAFFALRQAPEGLAPVVIKIVRPEITLNANQTATILVRKEAVALGRLNERVPPSPFVVRFVDTGACAVLGAHFPPLPWLAVEYVHGGIEGTNLHDRVRHTCKHVGTAFELDRAAHFVRSIASGLEAIHAVGVIHRDLTPGNILCCGFGEAELFKISDFGIARPQGMAMTFGDIVLGTPGYMAPEQNSDSTQARPATDVFGFACLLYYVLTGMPLFDVKAPVQALLKLREPRRSITESPFLTPDLKERSNACQAVDHAIERATALDISARPQTAEEFAASVIPWLGDRSTKKPRRGRPLLDSLLSLASPADLSAWSWNVRHPPGDDRIVQSAAWDVDGHCFAMTTRGPAYWTGDAWVDRLPEDAPLPSGLMFARRFDAGGWLMGGRRGTLAVYGTDGIREMVHCPDQETVFQHANGRFDDLLVAVAEGRGKPPMLWAMAAHRWMRPLPLEGVAYVATLLRLDDDRWIISGRLTQGQGFAAIYTPMQWEVTYLLAPPTRAFVGGASTPERGFALVVGSNGVALRIEGDSAQSSVAHGAPDLSAAAMDVLDREWAAGAGQLFVRDPAADPNWRLIWTDDSWKSPFVSVLADAGLVVAMTVDGGVIEGRAGWRALGARRQSSQSGLRAVSQRGGGVPSGR